MRAPVQGTPQPPQLALLVLRSTSPVRRNAVVVGGGAGGGELAVAGLACPSVTLSGGGATRPQVPQLLTSLAVRTQALPHTVAHLLQVDAVAGGAGHGAIGGGLAVLGAGSGGRGVWRSASHPLSGSPSIRVSGAGAGVWQLPGAGGVCAGGSRGCTLPRPPQAGSTSRLVEPTPPSAPGQVGAELEQAAPLPDAHWPSLQLKALGPQVAQVRPGVDVRGGPATAAGARATVRETARPLLARAHRAQGAVLGRAVVALDDAQRERLGDGAPGADDPAPGRSPSVARSQRRAPAGEKPVSGSMESQSSSAGLAAMNTSGARCRGPAPCPRTPGHPRRKQRRCHNHRRVVLGSHEARGARAGGARGRVPPRPIRPAARQQRHGERTRHPNPSHEAPFLATP